MKFTIWIVATGILFISAACGSQQTINNKDVPPPNTTTPAQNTTTLVFPKDGNYPGKGKVTKIDLNIGSVEFHHEEIVGLMPAMIMEFYVKDKAILDGINVGDNVDFVLEYKHPAETIVSITNIK